MRALQSPTSIIAKSAALRAPQIYGNQLDDDVLHMSTFFDAHQAQLFPYKRPIPQVPLSP